MFMESQNISQEMAAKIDREVKKFIDTGYKLAAAILEKNKKLLDKVAMALLSKETLEGEEFERLMGHNKVALAIVKS